MTMNNRYSHFPTTSLIARLDAMHTHSPACPTDAYRADDTHDDFSSLLRDLLCNDADLAAIDARDYPLLNANQLLDMRDTLALLFARIDDSQIREYISRLALDFSLCPLHLHDYAICFDDEFDECAAIRLLFPSHDT